MKSQPVYFRKFIAAIEENGVRRTGKAYALEQGESRVTLTEAQLATLFAAMKVIFG